MNRYETGIASSDNKGNDANDEGEEDLFESPRSGNGSKVIPEVTSLVPRRVTLLAS